MPQVRLEGLEDRRLLAYSAIPLWEEAGPAPIVAAGDHPTLDETQWQNAGAIQAVVTHPTNGNIAFVASVNGGVWKTENLTFSTNDDFDNDGDGDADEADERPFWRPVTEDINSLSFGAIAFDLADPSYQKLYAGNAAFSSLGHAGSYRRGLWRSTDGGETWVDLAAQFSPADTALEHRDIVGVQARGPTLIVATQEFNGGVFRSDNSGRTWNRLSGAAGSGLPDAGVTDLIADPTDAARFYVGVPGHGIYRSTQTSGGAIWQQVNGSIAGLGVSNFIALGANSSAVYAAIASLVTGVKSGVPFSEDRITQVQRSTDGGSSWTQIGAHQTNPPAGNLPEVEVRPSYRHIAFAADPSDPERTFLSGVFGHWMSGRDAATGVWTWEYISEAGANNTGDHSDHRGYAFDVHRHLLALNDGGIYRVRNPLSAPQRFIEALNNNMRITETADRFALGYDPVNDQILLGTQDNGGTGQVNFRSRAFVDRTGGDGNTVTVAVDGSTVYQYLMSNNYKSVTLRKLEPGKTPVESEISLSDDNPAAPNNRWAGLVRGAGGGLDSAISLNTFQPGTPLVANRFDSDRLLLGTDDGLYESSNRGENITDITPGDATNAHIDRDVTALAYGGRRAGQDAADVLYAGIDGGLWIRTSGTGSPTRLVNYPGGSPREIVLDPDDWHIAYVVDNLGRVFQTTDAGATVGAWRNLTQASGVPSIYSIALADISGVRVLLAGAENGVYRRINPGAGENAGSWSEVGRGMPNVRVYDVLYDPTDRLLLAGTLGRGVWRIPDADTFLAQPGKLVIEGDRTDPSPDGATEKFTNRNDYVRIAKNPQFSDRIDVFVNPLTHSSPPTYTLQQMTVSGIEINTRGGADYIQVDYLPTFMPLTIRGGDGGDTVYIASTDVSSRIDAFGEGGNDWFLVLPNANVEIQVDGGDPATTSPPADVLRAVPGGEVAQIHYTAPDQGTVQIGENHPIAFDNIELATVSGPVFRVDALEYSSPGVPNDTAAAATDLVGGDQGHPNLTVHEANNADWYRWQANAFGTAVIQIAFNHKLANLDLEVYADPSQPPIGASTSSGDEEWVSIAAQPGQTYYIRVWAPSGGVSPNYTLEIDWPHGFPDDDFEQNDEFAAAWNLGINDQEHHDLAVTPVSEFVEDEDWFKWRAEASGALTVDLKFRHSLGDLELQIYDAGPNLLADAHSSDDDEHLTINEVVAGQWYYIRVYGYAGSTNPDYDLFIDSPEIAEDKYPDKSSHGKAKDLGSGRQTHFDMSIDTPGEDDFFLWKAHSPGELIVRTNFDHSLGDLDLQLFDGNRQSIALSAGVGNEEVVAAAAQAGDIFYVRVYGYQGATNHDYDLSIEWPPNPAADRLEPNDSFYGTHFLGAGDRTLEELTIHPDPAIPRTSNGDWYRWRAPESGPLIVETRFLHAAGNLEMELYDSEGERLTESTTSEDGERMEWNVSIARDYILHVYGYLDTDVVPDYDLVIDGPDIYADVLESNNHFESAKPIGRGDQEFEKLTLHDWGNDDWYLWQASVDGPLDVAVSFAHSEGDIDLELVDENHNTIAVSASTTDREQLVTSVVAGQSIYIHVYGYLGAVNPAYRLAIDAANVPADVHEPNDTPDRAVDAGSGNMHYDDLTIHVPGNSDWFVWTAPDFGNFEATSRFRHAYGDVNMELYGANGDRLASSLSFADYENIKWSVLAGETYYVRMFGVVNRSGPSILMGSKHFLEIGETSPDYSLQIAFTPTLQFVGGAMIVTGTPWDDLIRFLPRRLDQPDQVLVRVNGRQFGPFSNITLLVGLGLEGGDDIKVDRVLGLPPVEFRGGLGNDRLTSAFAADQLFGDEGRDLLYSGNGHDRLYGGPGDDELFGDWGNDVLYGEEGNDRLRGYTGNDLLFGGPGRDYLAGDSGNDVLVGGEDADRLGSEVGRNLLIGGLGRDYQGGGSEGAILIGGATTHDANEAALRAILAEWASTRSLAERVARITQGVGGVGGHEFALTLGGTVFDDNAWNTLVGGDAEDWFFKFRKDTLVNASPLMDQITQ